VMLVALGEMLNDGGVAALVRAAPVAGHAMAPVQRLDRVGAHAQLQRQTYQGMGDAVVMAFKLDVTVDVHTHRLEDGPLPGLYRQGHQGRSVELREHARAAAGKLLEGTLVEPLQQGGDRVVDRLDAGELMPAQACEDPALYQ
jgi:hypothetical protein